MGFDVRDQTQSLTHQRQTLYLCQLQLTANSSVSLPCNKHGPCSFDVWVSWHHGHVCDRHCFADRAWGLQKAVQLKHMSPSLRCVIPLMNTTIKDATFNEHHCQDVSTTTRPECNPGHQHHHRGKEKGRKLIKYGIAWFQKIGLQYLHQSHTCNKFRKFQIKWLR